jgi:N-acetylneuraminate synthase
MNVTIGGRRIGQGCPVYVIAEAGSNHNGSLDQARRLIEVAREAGADAVKFQTFRAERMYARRSAPVDYLRRLGVEKTVFDIIKDMEMPFEWLPVLADHCGTLGVDFLTTPFDEACAGIAAPFVPAFKVASYELTHTPLLRHLTSYGKPIIVSTGAASVDEIRTAVAVCRDGGAPVCLTQCTARYPADLDTINVRTIPTLMREFDVPVGLSDHSSHPMYAPCAAVALGASIVEKHFTLSRRLPGPDHAFALEPDELTEMVRAIRETERVLGTDRKALQACEGELVNYRRSIFTAKAVRKGDPLTPEDLLVLRRSGTPATDVSPQDWDEVLGRKAARHLEAESVLSWSDLE